MERRVVVTGVGMVTPLGASTEESWSGLVEGRSGIRDMAAEFLPRAEGLAVTIAGPTDLSKVNTRALYETDDENTNVDKYVTFALCAADQAMKMAGLPTKFEGEAAKRAGCILGVGLAGYTRVLIVNDALRTGGPKNVDPTVIHNLTSNFVPAYVARRHNLRGPNFTTVSACTSGAHGVGEAYQAIKHGRADVMLGGGIEAGVDLLTVAGFAAMRALSSSHNHEPTKASRPFEKNRDGFVLAEGGGVLVLEDYEHAKRRGAKILAEMVGYGASEDAHHITAPSEEGEGAQRAMRAAIAMAKMKPEDIDYVNAHGTSTPMNDINEGKAIRHVFGKWADNGLMVSSTKSMTGHMLGGAGGVEAVISVMSLVNQTAPPTINYDEPDPEITLDLVPHKARKAKIRAVLSNAFGFGGTNGVVIFRQPEA
jgi:3-oxoacyl-[acyl-carrier-protein] synthase II